MAAKSATISKYLKSVVPLASSAELERTQALAKSFLEDGVGEKLQNALVQHASTKRNWLEDWWYSVAYLGFRSPVVIHSNPGFTFVDPSPMVADPQVTRASELLFGMLAYKDLVDAGQIPVETVRNSPLCMSQYDRIFSACRIPRKPEDHLVICPATQSKHIVVVRCGQFFRVDVYNPATGKPLAIADLAKQIKQILAAPVTQPASVGILTSQDRDIWADVHEDLEKVVQSLP